MWTLITSAVAIWADVILKAAANGKNYWLLLLGACLYFVQAIFWYEAYKVGKFSTVAIVYSIFTIILSIGLGVVLFQEKVGVREIVGIVLGIIAVILMTK